VETLLYRLPCRRIVTVSGAVGRALVERFGVAERRVRVVPNGIDTEAIAAASAVAGPVDMLFVGRVVPHKHVNDFLDAAAAVDRQRRARGLPAVRVAVVGGGPLLEAMRSRAENLWLPVAGGHAARAVGQASPATVKFVGSLADHAAVLGWIKSARVLVLPSTREGFGLVLAEAMACGTPCVAYDVPAVREVLGDGEAGVLVPPRDVPALAAAIDRVLAESTQRERLIVAGRRRVAEQYTAGRFAERIIEVYRT
jgi:glycosyltransferase involved in cell wall biosynthesis